MSYPSFNGPSGDPSGAERERQLEEQARQLASHFYYLALQGLRNGVSLQEISASLSFVPLEPTQQAVPEETISPERLRQNKFFESYAKFVNAEKDLFGNEGAMEIVRRMRKDGFNPENPADQARFWSGTVPYRSALAKISS